MSSYSQGYKVSLPGNYPGKPVPGENIWYLLERGTLLSSTPAANCYFAFVVSPIIGGADKLPDLPVKWDIWLTTQGLEPTFTSCFSDSLRWMQLRVAPNPPLAIFG